MSLASEVEDLKNQFIRFKRDYEDHFFNLDKDNISPSLIEYITEEVKRKIEEETQNGA